MAYGDFTLESALRDFGLKLADHPDMFADWPELAPSEWLTTSLQRGKPLALAIGTNKARSELIIAPILLEVRIRYADHCGLFSGTEFNVAPEKGLSGCCDFILSRSPLQRLLTAPVAMVIVEAKNLDIGAGYGQCVASMVAARMFNECKGSAVTTIFGAVSAGVLWSFVKLEGTTVTINMTSYQVGDVAKILGVLVKLVTG